MTKEELLAEVDDLIRLTPLDIGYSIPENVAWVGRAAALINEWNALENSLSNDLRAAANKTYVGQNCFLVKRSQHDVGREALRMCLQFFK